jgi:hypothetical protein
MSYLENENRKLGESLSLLHKRADAYKRLFEMSLGVIESFSHMMPDVADKFKAEVDKELKNFQSDL